MNQGAVCGSLYILWYTVQFVVTRYGPYYVVRLVLRGTAQSPVYRVVLFDLCVCFRRVALFPVVEVIQIKTQGVGINTRIPLIERRAEKPTSSKDRHAA